MRVLDFAVIIREHSTGYDIYEISIRIKVCESRYHKKIAGNLQNVHLAPLIKFIASSG